MIKKPPKIELPEKTRSWVNESHRNPNAKVLKQKKQAILCDLDAGDGIHKEYTEAGMVVFDQGTAVLPNDSRADDIAAELMSRKGNHRDRYALTRDREGFKRNPLHKMQVGSIGLPWRTYDDLGRIVEDD